MRKHAAKRKSAVRDLTAKTDAARGVRGGIIIICKPTAQPTRALDVRVLKQGDGSV